MLTVEQKEHHLEALQLEPHQVYYSPLTTPHILHSTQEAFKPTKIFVLVMTQLH